MAAVALLAGGIFREPHLATGAEDRPAPTSTAKRRAANRGGVSGNSSPQPIQQETGNKNARCRAVTAIRNCDELILHGKRVPLPVGHSRAYVKARNLLIKEAEEIADSIVDVVPSSHDDGVSRGSLRPFISLCHCSVESKRGRIPPREVLGNHADNLSKAGWSWGCVATIDRDGRTISIVDAHRDDGKRFVVRAEEKLIAFLELEAAIRG